MSHGFGDGVSPTTLYALRSMRVTSQMLAMARPDTVATSTSAAATERCRCMLDAVPGLDATQAQQGLSVCLQNPDAFAAQLSAAGLNAPCDASGGGIGPAEWYRTTPGMVGIAVGALALIGLGAAVLKR